mgnify:CR=1 FL=1
MIDGSAGAAGSAGLTRYQQLWNPSTCSCFAAGQKVTMADGTYKFIEDVEVGDLVLDAYGNPAPVLYLDQPPRGDRILWLLNGTLLFTSEHPIVNGDRDGFLVLSRADWDREKIGTQTLLAGDGNEVKLAYPGVTPGVTKLEQLATGATIATRNGKSPVRSIGATKYRPETLYNLVVGGSHTFYVNGIAVSGWSRDDDFDYSKGEQK